MATTNDLKNGIVLNLDGQLWTVTDFQHVKPGKGGAFVRTTLKNVLSGKVVDKTFNAGVKVETATVDRRDATYLYRDGSDFVFMDGDTYDQIPIPEATVAGAAGYLLENQVAMVALHEGVPLYVELPSSVELRPIPNDVSARVAQTKDYQYAVADNRVLLVSPTGRFVVGVFMDDVQAPKATEGRRTP